MRPRTEADLDACITIASAVHDLDGYPVYGVEDLRGFLTVSDALGIWVAGSADRVLGHVALRRGAQPGRILEVAAEFLDRAPERLCSVTRLLVAPAARRAGVGVLLLQRAVDAAAELGRTPVLGVDDGSKAVAFYERCGWRRVERITVRTPAGHEIDQVVYVAP
ncbi:MAG: GNAT family N-acetyltransferase [Acidimicrobiales bacterium]